MKKIKFNELVTSPAAALLSMTAGKLNDRVKRSNDKIAAKQEEAAWSDHEEMNDRLDNAGR
jgi:hypothetical protein